MPCSAATPSLSSAYPGEMRPGEATGDLQRAQGSAGRLAPSCPAAGGIASAPSRWRGLRGCPSLPVSHKRPLFEGEDYALVEVAAFELAVRVGGLLHGHGFA